jgi:hypothetical protein
MVIGLLVRIRIRKFWITDPDLAPDPYYLSLVKRNEKVQYCEFLMIHYPYPVPI